MSGVARTKYVGKKAAEYERKKNDHRARIEKLRAR